MSGMSWTGDLVVNVHDFNEKAMKRLALLMEHTAPRIESYAKEHAPWTDRSSNARRGLTAVTKINGDEMSIILFHKVPYGVWLEIRWSGRYAAIMPALKWGSEELNHGMPAVMK